ncbi:SRPBCC domain-containing protein [Cellulosimicrobium protaetiae]|uniref:Polyketide cyclase n=1 Tax=Cellulosimicrobium protaetiae TaxID=2587808 RepID=A0A6M5UC75_9MICO|nr:SRPBCC domain-containing protein [Cellulosimicrobium protaetiae]QJW35694.1 polyketide cyclase [Cellulosimicrobium protaetiae]
MTADPRRPRTPTGTVERTAGQTDVVLRRSFRATAADLWTSISEPAGLGPWIGTWDGDPASGSVLFTMTAEGATEGEECRILRCDPPHRLTVDAVTGESVWHLDLEIVDEAEGSTLVFRQTLGPDDDPANIGPGWEYYLDRLVAARSGHDVSEVVWEEYYPVLAAHYGDAGGTG